MQTVFGKRIQVRNRWLDFDAVQYGGGRNRAGSSWPARSEIHMGAFIQMEAAAVQHGRLSYKHGKGR